MHGYGLWKDFISVSLADPEPLSFLQPGAKKTSRSESAIPISAISELPYPKSLISYHLTQFTYFPWLLT